ncbi:MAG: GNAT family N-acetyltransferase [Robiginitomaculum sp.]|nr:GNAT family N-acetyltransferase [Robiginitomaculum sp.]
MDSLQTMILPIEALTSEQASAWTQFRAGNPALYSPYFHIGYTQLLGRLSGDVHVLVVTKNANPVAFLPFQAQINATGKVGFARPVGAPMTDYQGFICAPETSFDAHTILKQAGFGAYHFSTLIDTGGMLASYVREKTPCTVMDISMGAVDWRAARDSSYRRHLKSNRRRIRKSEAHGPRRFEFNSTDQAVFDQLTQWKREKFDESGKYDVLSANWTRALLSELWRRGQDAGLRTDMHCMYFGDLLAAVDLGLSDGTTFHSWMVAYNNEFYNLAPGIQLLEALIDEAQNLGYQRIDLGEGVDGYKRHYASENISVSSGFVAASGPAAALSKLYGNLENFGENKLGKLGRIPGKARRRYTQISACDASLSGRSKAMLRAVKGG